MRSEATKHEMGGWQGADRMRYQALAEAMPALVLTTTADGEVEYCNRELLEYCGVEMADLQGSRWVELIHPDDVASGSERWTGEIQTLQPFVSEYRIRRNDGAYRWYLTHTAPLRDANNEVVGWVGVSVDVHDRRMAEDDARQMSEDVRQMSEDVRQMSEEVARASAAKDEFLGLVSHELRTPVTTIYGNAQVLRQRSKQLSPEMIEEAMTDVEQEALRLQQLIDNMFVLARIEERGESAFEPIVLRQVISGAIDEHTSRYPKTDITVADALGGVPVCADSDYVRQIVRNLLGNAEKYSPEGTAINVSVEKQGETHAAVRICDRGLGIQGDISRIFEQFYRAPETVDYAPGAGIGLAVARRLVEVQGGEIWARHREGGGAEVGFTLPIETEDAA